MKKIFFALLTSVFVFCFSENSLSQISQSSHSPVVTLGNLDTTKQSRLNTTRAEILANPVLRCRESDCEIVGFTAGLSYKKNGEKSKYLGPFNIKGHKLTDQIIHLINELNGPDVKIYFENILVKYNGKEMNANAIYLKYNH